jgi:hypothetical protein
MDFDDLLVRIRRSVRRARGTPSRVLVSRTAFACLSAGMGRGWKRRIDGLAVTTRDRQRHDFVVLIREGDDS